MKKSARIIRSLLIILLALGAWESEAQIDIDGQLKRRGKELDDYDDSDRDRQGTLFSFYLSPRTGDKRDAWIDTLKLNYFHRAFVEGLSVAESYTSTYASPYQSKIYFDRPLNKWGDFYFTNPYNHLIRRDKRMQWYDTKTPYTFLEYNTTGSSQEQEQNFSFTFTSNLGKEWSLGADFDLDYANGFYGASNSKNVTYRVFSYYQGDRYQAYASIGNTNTVNQESGGITDQQYITNPDEFAEGRRALLPKDIPTKYRSTWNRVVYGSGRFFHKYSLGFYRDLDEEGNIIEPNKPQSKSVETIPTPPELPFPIASTDSISPNSEFQDIPSALEGVNAIPSDSIASMLNDSIPLIGEQAVQQIRKRAGRSSGQAEVLDEEAEGLGEERASRVFIPVTNFFHDFQLEKGRRSFSSLDPVFEKEFPEPVIPKQPGSRFFPNDRFYALKISNSLGVELVEGFHKWAKMGIAAFVAHDYKNFRQPLISKDDAERLEIDEIETIEQVENTTYVGGRISSNSFNYFDYFVWGQVGIAGSQAGEVEIKGELNTNFELLKQDVSIGATVDFLNTRPSYFLRRFKSSIYEWDQELAMIQMLRFGGELNIPNIGTRVFANFEMLQNPMVANEQGIPVQVEKNTQVLAIGIDQRLSWNILNWDNSIIWQTSSDQSITPLPQLSIYSNFYLRFLIAKVMTLQVGIDAKWHTKYHAPYYEPKTQLFKPQNEIEVGGTAPLMSAYANVHLKRARFFLKYYNVGAMLFRPDYFSMPYYPLYPPVLRLGIAVDLRN